LRLNRDELKAKQLIEQLEKAARTEENLVPIFIECVQHDLTLGEICTALRRVWGEYQPPVWG